MTVPVSMLWKVQISLRQKLALAGIFSLTGFIMVFAIIRVTVVNSESNIADETWLYLWSAIEQTVGMLFLVDTPFSWNISLSAGS